MNDLSQTGGDWEKAGEVVKMQVAGRRIRNGPRYDPSPLREVSRMRLSAEGVIGYDGSGWVLDSHHRAHPERTRFQPHRVLLIGFAPNYRRLWEEFRPTELGAAGEALIIPPTGSSLPPLQRAGCASPAGRRPSS